VPAFRGRPAVRSYLAAYDFRAPKDLQSVLRLLAEEPGAWRPFAGGTDLMVLFESAKLPAGKYVSLWGIPELNTVAVTRDAVTLGALTTYAEVGRHPILRAEFPLLCSAAEQTGGVATQNRGTIGGNIANGSPAADTPPALLAYDAEIELISTRGTRRVPYDRFHSGYKTMDLAADELIKSITLPRGRASWIQSYRKVGTRKAQAISKVCFAAAADLDGQTVRDIRVAFGSVAPAVVRCLHAESAMRGGIVSDKLARAAAEALAADIAPIDDIRSTAHYRFTVARNLLIQFVRETLGTADRVPEPTSR
jgi:CO/xanthine dehydrogenase FAD-binding subunit